MAVSRLISRRRMPATVLVLVAIAIAGCGSSGSGQSTPTSSTATGPARRARPQAIQPAAGVQASPSGGVAAPAAPSAPAAGDVNAHAPTLGQVKRELKQLNLCGGVTNRADATPLVPAASAGFVADPGTSQTPGQLPVLTSRLDALAKALGVTIYGISGYRTPAHSVAVGGFAHDPHTQGKAEDIGVNSLLRSSAAQISEPELARFGLYRPFDPTGDPNNTEVNHIQLIPSGGPLSLAQSTATWDPDPSCR
jgi:Peptidase M15